MSGFVRIKSIDLGEPDNTDEQIMLDLVVDDVGVAVWRFPTYGCRGLPSLNPSSFWPFALLSNGTLLQAHEPGDPGDIGETINIIGKQVYVGQVFTYNNGSEDFTYKITHVTPIEEMMR